MFGAGQGGNGGPNDQLTTDDVSRLHKAMKTKEFGNLMDDYVKEISDPNNRAEYDQYLEQLEAKGELPDGTELLRCEPGVCVRTEVRFKNGQNQKCFINICYSTLLRDVEMIPGEGGMNVSLPFSLSPPRVDQDKKGQSCLTCDFGISENSFVQCQRNPEFLRMMIDICTKNLEKNFLQGHEEVKNDFKVLKTVKCKGGTPYMMSVSTDSLRKDRKKDKRKKKKAADIGDGITPGELKEMKKEADKKMEHFMKSDSDDSSSEEEREEEEKVVTGRIRIPKHKIVHIGEQDFLEFENEKDRQRTVTRHLPEKLRLVVDLPTVKSAADIETDLEADNIVVDVPGLFYLDLPLPYTVDPDKSSAKFDKGKKIPQLTLTFPVVATEANMQALQLEDANSGIQVVDKDGKVVKDEGELRSDEDSDLDDIAVPESDPEDEKKKKEKDGGKSKSGGKDGDGEAAGSSSSTQSTKSTVDEDGEGEGDDEEGESSGDSGLGDLDSDPEKVRAQKAAGKKRKAAKKGSKKKGSKKKNEKKGSSEGEKKEDEIIQIDGKRKPKALYEGLSSDEEDGDFGDFSVEDEKEVEKFIVAKSFQGPLPGYYFGTGKEGTGYYRDEFGEWTGSNCRKGKKWRKNKKKIEVKIREEAKGGELGSGRKKDGLILEVTDRASGAAGGKKKDGKQDGKDGSDESDGIRRDFMGKKIFPSKFHLSHDIHITNNLTPAESKAWLLGRGLEDKKDKPKSATPAQKTPTVEIIRRGIVVPWETDDADANTTPTKKPTPQLPLTNLRETLDKQVLSSTSRSDFTAQSTIPYFIAHETRSNLVLAFPILELEGSPSEVIKQGKVPKIRVESSRDTLEAFRQIHLRILLGDNDESSSPSNSSTSDPKSNPNLPRSFVFQQAITEDLAVPQQWSYRTKILKSANDPDKKTQIVVLFSIRKGSFWVEQSDVAWEADAGGDDSPIFVELDEDGESKNGGNRGNKNLKSSSGARSLTFVEEKPENLTWKTAEDVRGFSKIEDDEDEKSDKKKKRKKKDGSPDEIEGRDGEEEGILKPTTSKQKLLGDGDEHEDEDFESDDEVDVTKKTMDSLIFVREEEADATMGQAVILRNRLFYELM